MISRIFYSILFLWGSIATLLAQQPATWQLKNSDGLPSSTVYKIQQDAKGYAWISTANGICRFDGKVFEKINTSQLSDNETLNLVLDHEDRPWVLNLAGQLSTIQDNVLTPVHFIPKTYTVKNVKICADRIWIVYNEGERTNQITSFAIDHKEELSLPPILDSMFFLNNSSFIEFGKHQLIFFARAQYSSKNTFAPSNIYQLDRKTSEVKMIPTDYRSSYDAIRRLSHMNLPGSDTLSHQTIATILNNLDIAVNQLAQKYQIKHMIIEGDNFYLLSRKGLYHYRHQLSQTSQLEAVTHYLTDLDINFFFKDKDDNIWLGTNDDGIHILSPSMFINYNAKNSPLPVNSIYCLYYDTLDQRLLLGQNNSFLSIIKEQQVERSIKLKNIGRVYSMTQSTNRRFWIGVDLGLSILDHQLNHEWTPFTGSYKAFSVDSRNNMWLGGSGIVKYTKLSEIDWLLQDDISMAAVKANFTTIGSYRTYALLEDFSENIWVGTTQGLFRYTDGQLRLVELGFANDRPNITDLTQGADSTIWVSSYTSGVVGLKDNKITHYFHQDHKLASNTAKTIFATADHKLWVGTDNGINIIDFPSLNSQWININDGLAANEINDIYVEPQRAWVATSNGLTQIELDKLRQQKPPTPPVQITKVQIFDQDTSLHQHYHLRYDQNNLKIDFLAIKYSDKAALRYLYQMEGVDQDWITTAARFVRYPLLNPGKYTFKVRAIDEDGSKSLETTYLYFTITTPWWKSLWFYFLITILTSGLVGGLFYLRLRFLKREQEYNNRLYDLKMDALKAQMNPHFIFNSLIAIQKYITTNEQEQANSYLSRFARLIRMIFNQSDKQAVSLTEELEFLNTYIALEKLRFQDKINIQLVVSPDLQLVSEDIFIPPLLIQPIIENAFKHGLMHKEKDGQLNINIERHDQQLVCSIEDNGVGRAHSQEITHRQMKKERASGINTTKSRLEIWNKNKNTEENIRIIDLLTPAGKPAGTKVILYIRSYD